MTKTSRELLEKEGIRPKLRLGIKEDGGGVKPTGAHRVKIVSDKVITKPDPATGKDIEWMRYLVEENETYKVYDTKLRDNDGQISYLVQRLAELDEGQEVFLEMKKRGIKNYISVTPVIGSSDVEIENYEEENYPEEKPEEEVPVNNPDDPAPEEAGGGHF